ncbi:DMT family transporter [candidate division WS5 bacterium]|uniref:DMT family transporter n=1 Tax=candidate division WS5 bacterium TaxID=2093353 RepID=A0A419DF10_9BACT|nr:MAG: DMT family transporter [candidate division WS5 bacterium]
MDTTTLSITLGIITMISLGIGNSMTKPITSKMGVDHYMLFRNFIMSVFLILVLFSGIFESKIDLVQILFGLSLSVMGYFGLTYLFKALKTTKVGLASPVSSVNVVFTILLTYLFLQVKLSPMQIVAILAIVLGIFLIRFDKNAIKNHFTKKDIKGLNYALISGVLMGVFMFLSQIPARVIGPILTPLTLEGGMFIFGSILFIAKGRKVNVPDVKLSLKTLLAIAFIAIAVISLYYGLKNGNPAIMFALYSANPIIAVLYGAVLFKERLNIQQYISISIVVIGIVLLRVFS